jgi:5-methylcytosine-specific restriction endonuclease McrA
VDAGPLPKAVPESHSRGSARWGVRPVTESAVSGLGQLALDGETAHEGVLRNSRGDPGNASAERGEVQGDTSSGGEDAQGDTPGGGEDDEPGGVRAGTSGGRVRAAPQTSSGIPTGTQSGSHNHKGGHRKALVLNATMEPLCVVPARRAVVLVLSDKADVVHANGHLFRSERLAFAAPSVVRLRRYVHVPYRCRAALSRRGVFIRDHHACQYCGASAENVDHVVPRSRGGLHEWENVVAACRRCNSRKKDQTPAEAHMSLLRTPFAPRAAFWLIVAVGTIDPDWHAYLGDTHQMG